MAEYIERDKVMEAIRQACDPTGCTHVTLHDVYMTALTAVECVPAADVKEGVHGEWYISYHYQNTAIGTCSACKTRGRLRVRRDDVGIWFIDSPFCPNCGAKMDTR